MNDLLLSLFALCATNNGLFKSEKQARFFAYKGEGENNDWEIYRVETFTFGYHGGCRRQIGYCAKFDNVGVTKIIKSDAKGDHVLFERGLINTYAEKRAAKDVQFVRDQQEVLTVDIPRIEQAKTEVEAKITLNLSVLSEDLKTAVTADLWEALVRTTTQSNVELQAEIAELDDRIAYLKKEFKLD